MIWTVIAIQVTTLVVALYAARKAMWAAQISSRVEEKGNVLSIRTTQETEALDGLYWRLGLERGTLPPTRGWAASPDVLTVLYDQARDSNARSLVECGSGTSTVVLARYCQQMGDGRLLSIDHDETFAAITRRRLIDLGLDSYVDLVVAPLVQQTIGEKDRLWYDLGKIELPETIDLAFVDGPPIAITGEDGRAPAGSLFVPRLSDGGRIIFDDAHRPGERRLIDDLTKTFPHLETEAPLTEKGCRILVNRGRV